MIVMKFGGTSVKDVVAFHNVIELIEHELHRKPLVVLSACAGATDTLIDIAYKASETKSKEALLQVEVVRKHHLSIADELLREPERETVKSFIQKQGIELEMLVKGVSILRELTPRVLDHFMSFGEQWSTLLLANALLQKDYPVALVDARNVMITDDAFNHATPILDYVTLNAKKYIQQTIEDGKIVVTQGFIGATKDRITTTLGRGGSDYSAAIFGSVLDAVEIQIWTDVAGVLTANPKIIPNARPVRELTFEEAAELAYFGARVLHPSTILPAIKKNIPVRVLNSHTRDFTGTVITANARVEAAKPNNNYIVKSIAHKTGITVIRIHSTRMLMAHGFLARVFDIFARYKKSVDVIATSEVGISLTVDDTSNLEKIVQELREIADVQVESQKAIICIVGEKLRYTHGIAARAFSALANEGINIEMISHGGSEINLTFVISEEQIKPAMISLHDEFFSKHTVMRDYEQK